MKKGYKNDPICPCVFIKKSEIEFAIIAVYVDDMHLIETLEELSKTAKYLIVLYGQNLSFKHPYGCTIT